MQLEMTQKENVLELLSLLLTVELNLNAEISTKKKIIFLLFHPSVENGIFDLIWERRLQRTGEGGRKIKRGEAEEPNLIIYLATTAGF